VGLNYHVSISVHWYPTQQPNLLPKHIHPVLFFQPLVENIKVCFFASDVEPEGDLMVLPDFFKVADFSFRLALPLPQALVVTKTGRQRGNF